MKADRLVRARGFTLVELLIALLVLSLLALMSYRGLAAVLDARGQVRQESEKWRDVALFFARFERDVQLAAPRAVRDAAGTAAAWRGQLDQLGSRLEFSRFASVEGVDMARRITYGLNDQQEIELWLWPGLDVAQDIPPARYPVLAGVAQFELQYLDDQLAWAHTWPTSARDKPIPHSVRLRLVLVSGEQIVRVFALR